MNKGFDEAWLEQLKSKNDIISIGSRYLTMQQKGRNYWACCPFHHEKTPSLCFYPYEQYYHCYGCKEHGDVISLIQKMESCDFLTAIEILAKNAGMEVPSYSMDTNVAKKKKDKETVLKILDLAAKRYEENLYLKTSTIPQNYIKNRKLTKRELDKFHLGYAKDWTDMITYLKSKGFSYEDMKLAGIAENKTGTDRYYDVMGERLIFPIYNIYDECIGFSARILTQSNMAKYKNSSNSIVFDKSTNLYGINYLKKLKQEQMINYIIIAEGQMDVIALHQAGFTNSVACLGTALTDQHVKALNYICNNVIVSLDGDSAGQRATIKTIDTLVAGGMNVKAVKIPENKDPDEYIKAYGKEKYQELLDNALDYIEFKIRNKLEQYDLSKVDEKAKFVTAALNIVNTLNTFSEQQVYLEIIKDLTGIAIDVLKRDLTAKATTDKPPQPQESKIVYSEDAEVKAIKFVMASLCHKKEYANFDFDLKKYLLNPTHVKLYDLMKQYNKNNEKLLISSLFDLFDIENEPSIQDLIDYNFEYIKNPIEYYNECIWKIRESYLKDKIKKLSDSYSTISESSQRLEIAKEINLTQLKLRNKVLED